MRSGIDINKANETRPFLFELGAFARRTGPAIIGIRHVTKGYKDKAIHSGIGSIDIVATAQEMQEQVAEPFEKRLQELGDYDRTEPLPGPVSHS